MALKSKDVVLTLEAGGAEDGSPSWGSPVTVTCPRQDYEESIEAVTVPDAGRCDDFRTTQAVAATGRINFTVPIPTTGTPYIAEGVAHYVRVTRTYTGGTTSTFVTAVRSNVHTVNGDERPVQRVGLEVQSRS